MKKLTTKNAPEAIGPYTQAIRTWNLLFTSWQIWLDPKTMKLVDGWIKTQTIQVCKNLWEILQNAWLNFKNVVKSTIYIDDINNFNIINKIYWEYFSFKPARSTIEVSKLPLWALIEIELIAEF